MNNKLKRIGSKVGKFLLSGTSVLCAFLLFYWSLYYPLEYGSTNIFTAQPAHFIFAGLIAMLQTVLLNLICTKKIFSALRFGICKVVLSWVVIFFMNFALYNCLIVSESGIGMFGCFIVFIIMLFKVISYLALEDSKMFIYDNKLNYNLIKDEHLVLYLVPALFFAVKFFFLKKIPDNYYIEYVEGNPMGLLVVSIILLAAIFSVKKQVFIGTNPSTEAKQESNGKIGKKIGVFLFSILMWFWKVIMTFFKGIWNAGKLWISIVLIILGITVISMFPWFVQKNICDTVNSVERIFRPFLMDAFSNGSETMAKDSVYINNEIWIIAGYVVYVIASTCRLRSLKEQVSEIEMERLESDFMSDGKYGKMLKLTDAEVEHINYMLNKPGNAIKLKREIVQNREAIEIGIFDYAEKIHAEKCIEALVNDNELKKANID